MTPNWNVHTKWAKRAGIDELVADVVNRFIDYGARYCIYDKKDLLYYDENERMVERQLKYFYRMDQEKKFSNENIYVKAYYIHHLLDFFTETRIDKKDIDLLFKQFLIEKVIIEFSDNNEIINFRKEIEEIFQLLKENKQELYDDLER